MHKNFDSRNVDVISCGPTKLYLIVLKTVRNAAAEKKLLLPYIWSRAVVWLDPYSTTRDHVLGFISRKKIEGFLQRV